MDAPDPILLAQNLIRCRSVTPDDGGALKVLENTLVPLGFICHRLRFQAEGTAPVENLYARMGRGSPHFCFAGHTDVVPSGDTRLWHFDPFGGEIRDGVLYGRGAADMKSAIAAFATAAARHVGVHGLAKGSISLLITGDEEGPSINGTRAMLGWLKENGERLDHCLVGEPTSSASAGDTIKIGRRGSMQISLSARGVQGHTAYLQNSLNPIPILATLVVRLASERLDSGTAHFEPSTLAFTTFDVGNPATNVSPAEARAVCNIRFNDLHTPASLQRRVEMAASEVAREMGSEIAVESTVGGIAFLTEPGPLITLISDAIARVTNRQPELSTGGGTSDARFIKDHCPVAEVGLPGGTMHKVDECAPVAEIRRLADIYTAILESYFAETPA